MGFAISGRTSFIIFVGIESREHVAEDDFLGQNEIHSDPMSWPCVRVRVHVNFSLNISETTTPRELIFGRNVPWVVLFKICSHGSEIPNNFRTGSEKLLKIASSLKIFFSRTISARSKQNVVS
jgi:hypothetical protein